MTRTHRAFLMSSIEQYLALIINVVVLAIMARILTPDEIGHAVTGLGVGAIALSVREFVTPEFLIQRDDISNNDLRSSFSLLWVITLIIAVIVLAAAPAISRLYDAPDLQVFLSLILISALVESVSLPVIAILRRNMAFGVLANIRTAALTLSGLTTVITSLLGFGYVSYAWGILVSSVALAIMAVLVMPYSWPLIWRPSMSEWRTVLAFGRFKGASQVIDRLYETVPQLILGKVMSMTSVAVYNRASTICAIPDRIVMSTFYTIAFPALAASVRDGRNIKQAYLRTLSYLSAVYWPGVCLTALTADPIVELVLGPQWHDSIILVRVLALASLFWVAVIVINPLLLALGHNRDAFLSSLACRSSAAILLCSVSVYGVTAMALSQFVALPAQMAISLYFAKRHLHFTISELYSAILPSATVTAFSMVGPLIFLALRGWNLDMNVTQLFVTLALAGVGWVPGVLLANHPLLTELVLVKQMLSVAICWLRRRLFVLGT